MKLEKIKREIVHYNGKSCLEEDTKLKNRSEESYSQKVELGSIIPVEQQAKFLENESKLFDAFCVLGNAYGIPIYPELTAPALINLEKRIIKSLRSIPSEEELSKVDHKRMESINELHKLERGVDYSDGKISNFAELLAIEKGFKNCFGQIVTGTKVVGTHIIATPVWGYKGILRYDHRDILRGAPEDANAYYEGKARLITIFKERDINCMWSLLSSETKLSPIKIPKGKEDKSGEYHIVPIKYYSLSTEEFIESKDYCPYSK